MEKVIFIDRDGVINKDPGGWTKYSYVTNGKDFHFLPGAIEALKMLNDNGYTVIVVSNQAGVSKGYFTNEDLAKVNERMLEEIKANGARLDEVYYCPHRDEDSCCCRKPKTGLFEKAKAKYDIDFNDTYFVGDSLVDVTAGKALGMKTIAVLSGKSSKDEIIKWNPKPDHIFKDLLESVSWIVKSSQFGE